MEYIYKETLNLIMKTQILVPITLDCQHLMNALSDTTGLEKIDVTEDKNRIREMNRSSIEILIGCLDILDQNLNSGWKVSSQYIENVVQQYLGQVKIEYVQNREVDIREQIQQHYKKIQDNVYEFTETLITQLLDDYLSALNIDTMLTEIIDNQMHRIAYDLFEFAYIDSDLADQLLVKIQSILNQISQSFFQYLMMVSYNANKKMHQLDELLKIYPSIANFENYKFMQHELAKNVIKFGIDTLIGTPFNHYNQFNDQIVKQAIKHFYYSMEQQKYWFQYVKHESFENLVNSAKFVILKPMPQNIQIISNQDEICLLDLYQELTVISAQQVQNQQYQGLKVQIQHKEKTQTFIIYLHFHYLLFHQHTDSWQPISDQQPINQPLLSYLNSQFDYLHKNHPEFNKRIQSEKSIDKDIDESVSFKNASFKFKKVTVPKKPIRYGARANMIGAKALGLGIGYLIVDCLDEEMPWEEKLEHAGFTAVSFGILGVLASRLPIVGLLIQQIILAIAVKSILDNKVISDQESTKNIGHLSVQIAIGVGMTIAGSVIFHVAFWGAFFGGLLGGVGMALYGKLVIPYAMENLMEMLSKTSILIRKNGVVRYKQYAIKKLKIDETFLQKRKPAHLSEDEFFTLIMFCLINETKLVCQAYYHKDMEKMSKKQKPLEMANILQRQVQREVYLQVWNNCGNYLRERKISLIENVKECAEFVEGMLANFKVQ